jgi:hypothetical protein
MSSDYYRFDSVRTWILLESKNPELDAKFKGGGGREEGRGVSPRI